MRAALASGGCVLAGPAGVGKSRLAADALRVEAERGRPVVRVVATASAATMPFGAFAHLLPPGPQATIPGIPDFLALLREVADGPCTLHVDDAHLLDGASAALLLAVRTTEVATLVLTVRSQEAAPDAVVSLWKDRLLTRIDLQPLAKGEVRLLVDHLLEGPASALVHEWAFELSQGNPLYVTELVDDARRVGGLVPDPDGRWALGDDRLRAGRLTDLIGAHVRAVSPDARAALEVLAIGAPVHLDQVEPLLAPGAAEELERARLVTITRDRGGARVLELVHPLYGEIVVAELPDLTARRIRRDLAGALIAAGTGGEAQDLRVATWLLEAGDADPDRFLAASLVALRRGGPDLAERLAEVVDGGLDAALVLAKARNGMTRFEDVEAVLGPLEAAAAAAPEAVAADYVETRYRALLRAEDRTPEEAAALLERAAGWHDDADWRALLTTQHAWARIYEGCPRQARDLLRPFVDDPDLSPLRRFHVLVVSQMAITRLALVDECEDLHRRLLEVLDGLDPVPWEAGIGLSLIDHARAKAGRDLDGVALAIQGDRQRREAEGDRPGAATAIYLLAYLAISRGHARQGHALLTEAVDLLSIADPLNNLAACHTGLAHASAMLGDAAAAKRSLEAAAARTRPAQAGRLWSHTATATATLEASRGQLTAARERLLEVAERAREDVVTRSESIHGALVLGADAATCAAQLEELAAGAQDELVHLQAQQARAMADERPSDLLAVGERLEALGFDLFAAEAAALAAAMSKRQALRDGERRAAAVAARCAARCEGVTTPAMGAGIDAPALTAREREIAGLAARGLSNAQIAEVLVLSVRSVETYVLRACRKLGVTSRTELPAVLGEGG